jgi:F0F1-type ATP synthase epsilon subunit
MSENEDRDSGKIGAFLLGFLTGVLVCLGAGVAFFGVVGRRAEMAAREAMMVAEMERARAEEALRRAEVEAKMAREREQKAVEEAKKEKPKEEGK